VSEKTVDFQCQLTVLIDLWQTKWVV